MSRFKVICNCGWEIETNDRDTLNTACTTHDKTCPALFKPSTLGLPRDQQQPAIVDGGHG